MEQLNAQKWLFGIDRRWQLIDGPQNCTESSVSYATAEDLILFGEQSIQMIVDRRTHDGYAFNRSEQLRQFSASRRQFTSVENEIDLSILHAIPHIPRRSVRVRNPEIFPECQMIHHARNMCFDPLVPEARSFTDDNHCSGGSPVRERDQRLRL